VEVSLPTIETQHSGAGRQCVAEPVYNSILWLLTYCVILRYGGW
jgi:hypothetical protein